jgi:hypothetical protein
MLIRNQHERCAVVLIILVFLLSHGQVGMSGHLLLEVCFGVDLAAKMIRPSNGRTERAKPC